ncbi:TPA: Do family serine endopeptidase [Candidatus Poribacteria bacterium]|nr:Do family serine endopeptidase [Candidatus Poribacteria bacterium]HIB92614.1 Do family serine endopeptidase [Candidatus Poribacteria bacterium]HIC01624.1 Do family serine endopeptidase [Candidatus Poribacteria bacterium]HIN28127.1 Do family serine endopeptidase [Candidatus Poribacteria bacterium]HIO46132.1 Do family serine endopeptidase [Candidatus Poribacteria bacterium]
MMEIKKVAITILLVTVIILGGITVDWDNQKISSQTAVSQVDEIDLQYLERANNAFIKLVKSAKPAVVQISTSRRVGRQSRNRSRDRFEDFFRFFPEFPERRQPNDPEEDEDNRDMPSGLGSGVIASSSGYILTNNHVIQEADDIKVTLSDGREFDAEVVGTDSGSQGTDLAVLKINADKLSSLEFGDSDQLQVGEWVVAIGSPLGLDQTVTRGIVSAKGRSTDDIRIASYADFIQTDASINRGNSGGALINIRGQLVGINTAIATGGGLSYGNIGIGFAIPSKLVQRVMTQLIEKGEVERGWLGVMIQDVDHNLSEKLEFDSPHGALITMVGKNSPAEKGGMRHGDVVLEFNGVQIRDRDHLRYVVASTGIDSTVPVKVIRQGKKRNLKIKLAKRTEEAIATLSNRVAPPSEDADQEVFSGIQVQNLTSEMAKRYNHQDQKGVIVIKVKQRTAAARAGIQEGDLIQEIDWEKVENLDDYRKRLDQLKDESKVTLYIRHESGNPEFITINVEQNED